MGSGGAGSLSLQRLRLPPVFGPVPSRRLGRSLGIDPLEPKTCNYNCVYCQLGRTRKLVTRRQVFVPLDEIRRSLSEAMERIGPDGADWVTVVGSGEPLLYKDLGTLIRVAREETGLPVAVITNGSMLSSRQCAEEAAAADALLPSLDAADPNTFKKLNRPHPSVKFDQMVQGLARFREFCGGNFRGKVWLEVMLVSGLNDSEKHLLKLRSLLDEIAPDRVDINVPGRVTSEPWVKKPDAERLREAASILGAAPVGDLPTVRPLLAQGEHISGAGQQLVTEVASLVARHPMSPDELSKLLGVDFASLDKAIKLGVDRGVISVLKKGSMEYVVFASFSYG